MTIRPLHPVTDHLLGLFRQYQHDGEFASVVAFRISQLFLAHTPAQKSDLYERLVREVKADQTQDEMRLAINAALWANEWVIDHPDEVFEE